MLRQQFLLYILTYGWNLGAVTNTISGECEQRSQIFLMTVEMSLFMALLNPINLNINKNESVILQRPNEMMMIATIMRNKNGEINTVQIITPKYEVQKQFGYCGENAP